MKLENIIIILAIIMLAIAALGLAANSKVFFITPMVGCFLLWLLDLKFRKK